MDNIARRRTERRDQPGQSLHQQAGSSHSLYIVFASHRACRRHRHHHGAQSTTTRSTTRQTRPSIKSYRSLALPDRRRDGMGAELLRAGTRMSGTTIEKLWPTPTSFHHHFNAPRGPLDWLDWPSVRTSVMSTIIIAGENPVTRNLEMILFPATFDFSSLNCPASFDCNRKGTRTISCPPPSNTMTHHQSCISLPPATAAGQREIHPEADVVERRPSIQPSHR